MTDEKHPLQTAICDGCDLPIMVDGTLGPDDSVSWATVDCATCGQTHVFHVPCVPALHLHPLDFNSIGP